MSFSQPNGYRISRSVSLTGLSRVVVHHGRMKRRDAAVHIIASVLDGAGPRARPIPMRSSPGARTARS